MPTHHPSSLKDQAGGVEMILMGPGGCSLDAGVWGQPGRLGIVSRKQFR